MPGIRILAFHELAGAPLVRMLSLGWAELDAHAWDHPAGESRFWTLYRNRSGGTTITTRDGSAALKPRQAYLIPPNTRFARSNRLATAHLYAYFDVFGIDPLGLPALIPVPGSMRAAWLDKLAATPGEPAADAAARLAALVATTLAPQVTRSSASMIEARGCIAPALAAMQADPARGWSRAWLAGLCGCAADTFGRRFQLAVGQTPAQWLRAHRARLAAHRLATGDDSLARIARDVGFGSRPYLSRVFQAVMGVGPSEYRRGIVRGRPLGPS